MASPIEELRAWARHMTEEVPEAKARNAVERAMFRVDARAQKSGSPKPTRVARRLTPVLVASMVFGLSNVALAAVANPSIPGDPLYGIDRAYERVAVLLWSGQYGSERLDEALAVLDRGQSSVALELVEEALTDLAGQTDANEARRMIDELSTKSAVSEAQVADLVEIARTVAADLAGASDSD